LFVLKLIFGIANPKFRIFLFLLRSHEAMHFYCNPILSERVCNSALCRDSQEVGKLLAMFILILYRRNVFFPSSDAEVPVFTAVYFLESGLFSIFYWAVPDLPNIYSESKNVCFRKQEFLTINERNGTPSCPVD
jgi:hypothetical protein